MINKRRLVGGLAKLAAAAAVVASTAAHAADTIKVGVLHSLSGTMAISETSLKDTALMADRRDQHEGRRAGQEARAGGRRPGVELAAVRREGQAAAHEGQGRRGVRLLDIGVAQVGAAGVRGAQRPAVLPGAVRRRRAVEERVLHGRRAEPAGDPRRRVPDEQDSAARSAGCSLGTDYVYPRTTNKILRAFLQVARASRTRTS